MTDLALRNVKTAPCKGCGRAILWAQDDQGQAIPLDPSAIVYRVALVKSRADGTVASVHVERDQGFLPGRAFASHFSTCSHAAEFSGTKRKAANQGGS